MSEPSKNLSPAAIFSQFQWKKDFLNRPEGRVGLVVGILFVIGLFAGVIKPAMDAMASIAWDLVSGLVALVSFCAIAAFTWALAPVLWKFWQVICRNMHRYFIRMAPLAHLYAYREDKAENIKSMCAAHEVAVGTAKELKADRKSKRDEAAGIEARINALGTKQAIPDDDLSALNQQALALSEYLEELNTRISVLDSYIKKAQERIRSRKKSLETVDLKIRLAESRLKTTGSMKALTASIRKDVEQGDEMSDGMVALKFIDEDYSQAEGSFDALDFEMESLNRKDRLDELLANAEGLSRLQQAVADSDAATAPKRIATGTVRVASDDASSEEDDDVDPYAKAFGSEPRIRSTTRS